MGVEQIMPHKEYHKRTNPLYKNIKATVGYRRFHIYNILPEKAQKKDIDGLRGGIQGLKWDGLLTVVGKVAIKIRGVKREVVQYQLI